MKITVKKITDHLLMKDACDFTMMHRASSSLELRDIYRCEHSPMRTQMFVISMRDIPTFVSVHFVRHSATGQQHYVGSNRKDRGGELATRLTKIDHMMILNAQHIIDISKMRLCKKASKETREVWQTVLDETEKVDPDLVGRCVPKCVRRQGCNELKTCGFYGN